MGNKSYINQRPFRILLTKQGFFENESITGEICIEPEQTIILSDVIIRLKMQEKWEYQVSKNHREYERNSQILMESTLNIGSILGISTDMKSLVPGQYHFPFTFPVINQIQPTFEYSSYIYVRFTVQAEAISSNIKLNAETLIIIKRGPSVLMSPLSFTSNINVHTWGLFDQGSTLLQVSYPKNNYIFGEIVPLNINVDNTKGKKNVIEIKVNFKRLVTLKRKTGKKMHTIKVKVYEKRYTFPVNSGMTNQTAITFPLTIPNNSFPYYGFSENPYSNNTNYSDFIPTIESVIISCQYYIKVSCYFDGFVTGGYRPAVNMPIVISHQVMNIQGPIVNNQKEMNQAIPIINQPLSNNPNEIYPVVNNNYNIGGADYDSAPPQPQMQPQPMVYDINQPVMYDKI